VKRDFVAGAAKASHNAADQSACAAGIFYVVEVKAERWKPVSVGALSLPSS
jgi:hypothetical protein